ncbi:glycosyltransferase [Cupriavidus basilensis]|uniref:Glycosyltransferase n=1 Tax=Cupriavidus basilensis TaxID=68895 RepID=A0ABT6B1L2_9BURK|nr:glycosyltransferase [Cupriavidus basilensis]MDF3838765.1 glycosyltransferase [Cupriavidus basilensis]
MKKISILIIAYDWPPRNSIASHRPYAWAKSWSRAGAKVTVLTAKKCAFDEPLDLNLPALPDVHVVEVPYFLDLSRDDSDNRGGISILARWAKGLVIAGLKKFKGPIMRLIDLDLDIRDGWARKAGLISSALVKEKGVDLVVSTYGPRGCHVIASEIKKYNPKIRWVADYRDLWSQNHLSNMTSRQKIRERDFERRTMKEANLVTTVSAPLAESLCALLGKDVEVVYNGYDLSLDEVKLNLSKKRASIVGRSIKIVYTGIIYPGRRDPGPLFSAINDLLKKNEIPHGRVEVHFYGARQPELGKIIESYAANSYVHVHGHVTRDVALQAQKSADLLLLLESGSADAKGVLTGKIFEYVASGTPILSVGSEKDSAIGQLIDSCGVGVVCGSDFEAIRSVIISIASTDDICFFKPNINTIKKFSRSLQSDDFLERIELLLN